jgi:thioredoxin reductase
MKLDYDIVIVGAGAAGVGMAHVLKTLGIKRFTMLERHEVGASFLRWPKEMRFISPSFTGNAFGLLDLNAVTRDTSPAYTLETEHPSGRQFAEYLQLIVQEYKLPVKTGVEVLSLRPGVVQPKTARNGKQHDETDGFTIETLDGAITARFVIWAAGEFQYPKRDGFPGAELCVHNATITSWRAAAKGSLGLPLEEASSDEVIDEGLANHFIVIGGNESGIDAAVNLARHGCQVTVLDRGSPWEPSGSDPSKTLTPYTLERLERALNSERLDLVGKTRVKSVTRDGGLYTVKAKGKEWMAGNPPILATGFTGSLSLIERLFVWLENGSVELTEEDESSMTPGLFVTGPMVRHDGVIFCFIYKFRQRFAVVAKAIAERLGIDTEPLEQYRKKQMFLDDLSCCEEECAC